MTVSSQVNRKDYAGNGSTTNFATEFRFLEDSHLRVILTVDITGVETVQSITTNYTVAGKGEDSGGTVTMIISPVFGETLTIKRNVPVTQQTDYVENDDFPAESHERALDKLTMIVQEQQEEITRSLKLPESNSGEVIITPEQGKFLVGNSTGGFDNVNIVVGEAADNVVNDVLALSVLTAEVGSTARVLDYSDGSNTGVMNFVAVTTGTDFADGDAFIDGVGVQWKQLPQRIDERTKATFVYQTNELDADLITIVPEGGAYNAFPHLASLPTGRVVCVYWHGNGHSPTIAGDNLGEMRGMYSDDAGLTWSTPVGIIGNITAGDSNFVYFAAVGQDGFGNIVMLASLYNGTFNEPGIMTTRDGIRWTDWQPSTFTGEGAIPVAPLPFGAIKTFPDGTVGIPFIGSGVGRWIGRVDTKGDIAAVDMDLIIDVSVEIANEFAICLVSELEQYAFLRTSGATTNVPIRRTVDGGANWADFGTMNIQVTGGWVPQDAQLIKVSGRNKIAVLIGARKSASAPPDDSPAAMLFTADLSQARTAGSFTFVRSHIWPLADDAFIRDAYMASVYDHVTNSMLIVTHNETADDESKILAGAVRIGELFTSGGDPLPVTVTDEIQFNSVTATYGTQTNRFTKIGSLVFFRIEMAITGLDTADGSGIAIITSAFPYPVVSTGPCSIDLENSTLPAFSSMDVVRCEFSVGNGLLQLNTSNGTAYAYSAKMNTSGNYIIFGQYET